MDYPKDLYTVCVIADNCTDFTADISRSMGATVIEHTSMIGEPKGKPHGIKYALEVLGEDLAARYDGVAIFDADNLVSANYLQEMNNHLINGDRLIQCYLDTKNPNDNWVTLSYATSYYFMNRSWQLSKSRLGLGNAVGGTGFCVETKLLAEVGWTAQSLTEDLEFTMQCLLRGIPAKWSHYARIYDEKPQSFLVSCVQRLRWARGHWDVCYNYAPQLFWKAIKDRNLLALDGAMYLVNPGKIVFGAATAILFYQSYITGSDLLHAILPMYVWLILIGFNMAFIVYCIVSDSGRKDLDFFKAVVSLLVMNITYVPLFVWAIFTTSNRTWKRTEHSRSMTAEEIEKIKLGA